MSQSQGFASEVPRSYGATAPSNPAVAFAGAHFNPTEMHNLCENISTSIHMMNAGCKNLQDAIRVLGTQRDTPGLRNRVHVTQLMCKQLATQATKELQQLSVVSRGGGKQEKLQVERLSRDFRDVVQCYNSLHKEVAERLRVPAPTLRDGAMVHSTTSEDEESALQEQLSMQRELEWERDLLLEREERVRAIENNVTDVGDILRELATLVEDQGATVDSLESHLESTYANVELGQDELEKAALYQRKVRRKLCILVGVAVLVGTVLAVIIVTQLK